jgi:hypothetical protein
LACHLSGSVCICNFSFAQKKAPVLTGAHGYHYGVPLPDHALIS